MAIEQPEPWLSIGLTILVFVFIFEHSQIALIATLRDIMVFQSLQHSTTRLVSMRAVAELAVFREVENLTEIARKFFGFHVESAETFDAGRINNITTLRQFEHLTECRCVHTCIVCITDFSRTEVCFRQNLIDKCALSHATVTA